MSPRQLVTRAVAHLTRNGHSVWCSYPVTLCASAKLHQRFSSTQRLALGSALLAGSWLARPCSSSCEDSEAGFLSEEGLSFLAEEAGIYLPVKLFLVGSTGAGKSALGNFILDPLEEHIFEQQTFQTGETCESCTEVCNVGDRGKGVVVVDTPGFHESHAKDFGHMIDVVRTFSAVRTVHGVALVKKFDSRLDQPWRDTVMYYKDLLGSAMESNVIVVLTGCDDSKLGKRRKAFGDQRAAKIAQTAQEVQKILGLSAQPPVFLIDALPEEEHARAKSCQVRQDILRHVARRRPVPLKDLQVPKTPLLRQQDETEAGRLEGQVQELEVRVKNLKTFAWASRVDVSRLDPAEAQRQMVTFIRESTDLENDPEIREPLAELTSSIAEKRARIDRLRCSHMTIEEADRRCQLASH